MDMFELRELKSKNIEEELKLIGFDKGYRFKASEKFKYKNIKIYNLNPAQANILKQIALSIGADCATHRDVILGRVECSDVILGGSISQLKKISQKLNLQPFKLKELGEKINQFISDKSSNKTKIVGILNVTPDSFSDGGFYLEPINAQKHLMQMIEDGADIIDIGAESTRPYSEEVSASEQIKRLHPILDFIQKENIKIPISIDTRTSDVADFALNSGATVINDVSGFDFDIKMAETAAKYNSTVILQHSKGTPKNMQNNPVYENLIDEIYKNLKEKIDYAKSKGITNIIADPGIGFGKTKEQNYEILERIEEFYSLNCPIMVGLSRKSFLGAENENNDIKDALSLAVSYPLLQKGVHYLRVHNVKLYKHLTKHCIVG